MGLLDVLRPGIGAAELAAAAVLSPGPLPMAPVSPWAASGNLESIVWADIFGADAARPLTRGEAIRVPSVARARGVICSTIARIELGDYRGETRLTGSDAASWIGATDGAVAPLHRMLWTVDDLLFYGWSCWRVTVRSAPDAGGRTWPLRMDRIPMGEWQLEANTGRVLIYKPDLFRGGVTMQPATAGEVVLIPGPHEGILIEGGPALRHARDLQRTAHNAARFPSAYLALSQDPASAVKLKRRSDDPDEVTVETIMTDWRAARLNPDGGGVAYLGSLKAQELGTFGEHLVTEGRNAADVDVARHAYIPADLIDAVVAESSLHYSTSRDNDRRLIDYGVGAYMSCVSARLSQNDVHPNGRTVAFDLEKWLEGSTDAPGEPAAAPAPGLASQTGETPQ